MQRDDFTYYSSRAEQEYERSRTAGRADVAAVHLALCDLYRERAKLPPRIGK